MALTRRVRPLSPGSIRITDPALSGAAASDKDTGSLPFPVLQAFLREEDGSLEEAKRVWDEIVKRRMTVTGEIGVEPGADYAPPVPDAGATAAFVRCGQKLLEATGNGEYAEVVERTLFNAARDVSAADLVAGMSDGAFYLHQFVAFEAETPLARFTLEGEWTGVLRLRVEPKSPREFEVRVRIPDWAEDVSTELPGLEEEADFEDGYAVFRKLWEAGDVLTIELGAEPLWVEADPRVRPFLGRAALTYGPLVYGLVDSAALFSADTNALVEPRQEGEGTVLPVEGRVDVESFPDALYAPLGTGEVRPKTADFVPYHTAPGAQVWVRRTVA